MIRKTHKGPPPCRSKVAAGRVRRGCAATAIATAVSLVPALAFAQPEPAQPVAPPMVAPPMTEAPAQVPAQAPALPEPAPMTAPSPMLALPPQSEPPAPPSPESADANGHERTLSHHVFLFPAYVTSSLVVSNFGLRIRLGTESVPRVPTANGNSDINTVTLSEGLDLGIKLTDWLGVFVTGGVRSLIGTNLRALTYAGATYDLGFRGGAILRLFRSERTGTQLSLVAAGGHTRGQISTLYPIFDQPILSAVDLLRGDLGESIKTPFSTSAYEGSLAFAQGFSHFFGVQASASVGGSTVTIEPYDRIRRTRDTTSIDGVTYAFGVAPSIDLNAVHVPIAVMPEYVIARKESSAQLRGAGSYDTTHQLALGVYYSGRVNLQVGLIWSTVLSAGRLETPLGRSDVPTQTAGTFILRYVW
jgi:hypothetical protein